MAEKKKTRQPPYLVRAIKQGFYPDPGAVRARARAPGDEFVISTLEHFAGPEKSPFQWMEWADEPTSMRPEVEPASIMSVPARLEQDPLHPGAPPQPSVPAMQPAAKAVEEF